MPWDERIMQATVQNYEQIMAVFKHYILGVNFYKLNKNEILVRSHKALLQEACIL